MVTFLYFIYNAMVQTLVVLNRHIYMAEIKNFGFSESKIRPVIVLKQGPQKVLALQMSTSNKFGDPQYSEALGSYFRLELPSMVDKSSFAIDASHWLDKKHLTGFYIEHNQIFEISRDFSNVLLNIYIRRRESQVLEKVNKINKYINIATKTDNNSIYIAKSVAAVEWLIMHSRYKRHQKIKNARSLVNRLIRNGNSFK